MIKSLAPRRLPATFVLPSILVGIPLLLAGCFRPYFKEGPWDGCCDLEIIEDKTSSSESRDAILELRKGIPFAGDGHAMEARQRRAQVERVQGELEAFTDGGAKGQPVD